MYFAVVKLSFEAGRETPDDRKALHALAEKIRARFKVSAAAMESDDGAPAVAIAALASSEERLTQTLDNITELCERDGFGRVAAEEALVDHIDAIADFTDADD